MLVLVGHAFKTTFSLIGYSIWAVLIVSMQITCHDNKYWFSYEWSGGCARIYSWANTEVVSLQKLAKCSSRGFSYSSSVFTVLWHLTSIIHPNPMFKVLCKILNPKNDSKICDISYGSHMCQWRQWSIRKDRAEILLHRSSKGHLVRCSSIVSSLWRRFGSYRIRPRNGRYIKLFN